jgi:hypothetical protein
MKRTAAQVIAAWRAGNLNNDDGELASAINYWVWTDILPDLDRQNQAVRELIAKWRAIPNAETQTQKVWQYLHGQRCLCADELEAALQVAGAAGKEGG